MCPFHSRLKYAVDFVHTAELGTRKVEGRFINTGMSARAGKIDNRLCGDGGKFWTISDRGGGIYEKGLISKVQQGRYTVLAF